MTTVADTTAIALVTGAMRRQIVSTGRIVALAAIGLSAVALAAVIGFAGDDPEVVAGSDAAELVVNLGLALVVPMASLVFASAALGDSAQDGTLIYLWLRPMRRWTVAFGGWLAAFVAALPFTLVPTVAMAALLGGFAEIGVGTIVATVLGTAAYVAMFSWFGLIVRNPIMWGLLYVFVWEGILAGFGTIPARVAVRGYTRSIVENSIDTDPAVDNVGTALSIVVLVVVLVVALVVTAHRLDHSDVK